MATTINYLDKTGAVVLVDQVKALLAKKVDKEDGKGLSSNDFTAAYKQTLDDLDTTLTTKLDTKVDKVAGKALSANDFTDDYKAILDGYADAMALKADLASPTFTGTVKAPTADSTTNDTTVATTAFVQTVAAALVGEAIGNITGIKFEIVDALPETGVGGTFYLIADTHSDKNDSYDEYIWIKQGESYVFEKIGNTDVDLTAYAKTDDFVAITDTEIKAMFATA